MRFFFRIPIVTLAIALSLGAGGPVRAESPDISEFLGNRGYPYTAFDRLEHTRVNIGAAALQIGFAPGEMELSRSAVVAWVTHCADVIAHYYKRFPVASVRILIVPVDGDGVRGGTTFAYRGAAIRILLGKRATTAALRADWMLVHEMVHLALPDLASKHNWLSEGLATYIEPIARAQAGDLTPVVVWSAMLRDMPQGLPRGDDGGLDVTHTWGRTYWGGAIFCLLADIGIRRQSQNRLGLRDAMRGVIVAGGNHEVEWPIERVLQTADAAVGGRVLQNLYAQMGTGLYAPDLEELWNSLGVNRSSASVVFDDAKPLAKIRRGITE